MTADELGRFFDSIDNYSHELMFRTSYKLGCRVAEFVGIQVKHLNSSRSTVFLPAENTKTKHRRTGYLPKDLMNGNKSMLKQKATPTKRTLKIWKLDVYLFHLDRCRNRYYSETASTVDWHFTVDDARMIKEVVPIVMKVTDQ